MKVLIIGDVGVQDGALHAGDEAMLSEAVRQLRARGATDVTVVSSTPADTADRYGVAAVPRLGFSLDRTADEAALEARLDALTRASDGEPGAISRDDVAHGVLDAIAATDLVVIAGAGNLSSSWPHHVYERAAIVRMATSLSRPVVISGQTLGPTLSSRHGELVREMLQSARLVGVREAASQALVPRLHASLQAVRTYDDALAISGDPVADLPARYCATTVPPSTGLWPVELVVAGFASLLDHVVETHDLDIVLVPHVAPLDGSSGGDVAMHDAIVAQMRHSERTRRLGPLEPAQTASAVASAELVVSARYHPIVFALAHGVPAVGVSVDEYTETKIAGAQAGYGLEQLTVPVLALATGDAADVVDAAVALDRAALVAAGTAAVAEMERWWDAVAATTNDAADERPELAFAEQRDVVPADVLAAVDRLATWQREQSRALFGPIVIADQVERLVAAQIQHVRALENAVGEAEAARIDAELRAQEHEQALEAAHERIATIAEPIIEQMWNGTRSRRHVPGEQFEAAIQAHDQAVGERDEALRELSQLHGSRTMRWTRGMRGMYRVLRTR